MTRLCLEILLWLSLVNWFVGCHREETNTSEHGRSGTWNLVAETEAVADTRRLGGKWTDLEGSC